MSDEGWDQSQLGKKEREEIEVEERPAPPRKIVCRAIRHEGEDELKRNSRALAWSGLADVKRGTRDFPSGFD